METKICKKCGEVKEVELFPKGRNACRECRKKYLNDFYRNNLDSAYQNAKSWRLENPEKRKEIQKKYRENNKEKIHLNDKIYRKSTIGYKKRIINQRICYLRNPVKKRQQKKIWRLNNPEKVKETNRKIIDLLSDGYVISKLKRQTGLPISIIKQYPKLIKAKRLIIQNSRTIKTLTK